MKGACIEAARREAMQRSHRFAIAMSSSNTSTWHEHVHVHVYAEVGHD